MCAIVAQELLLREATQGNILSAVCLQIRTDNGPPFHDSEVIGSNPGWVKHGTYSPKLGFAINL